GRASLESLSFAQLAVNGLTANHHPSGRKRDRGTEAIANSRAAPSGVGATAAAAALDKDADWLRACWLGEDEDEEAEEEKDERKENAAKEVAKEGGSRGEGPELSPPSSIFSFGVRAVHDSAGGFG
ncbi:hypothetical protein Vretimale_10892, partial [Volvox reticuliferus]